MQRIDKKIREEGVFLMNQYSLKEISNLTGYTSEAKIKTYIKKFDLPHSINENGKMIFPQEVLNFIDTAEKIRSKNYYLSESNHVSLNDIEKLYIAVKDVIKLRIK